MRLLRRLAAIAVLLLTAGPLMAQSPPAPPIPGIPSAPSPLQPGDPFGLEVTLPERTIVMLKGEARWDNAFETLVEAFKSLHQYMEKQGLAANGPALVIYTDTDDTGFKFQAALPIDKAPKTMPKGDISVGPAPSGKALKFMHRGSYDAMDTSYEAITNYLDEKRLEAKDMFIEEYPVDPAKADQTKLAITIYVPIK
jgi:effector-binding domain-containing protein